MSPRHRILASSLLFLPLLLLPVARAQDGTPDISGIWTGTVKFKTFPMDPADPRKKGKLPGTMVVEQTGPDIDVTLTLVEDEGPFDLHMTGKVGNGSMWAYSGDPDEPLIVSGRIKGKAPKLKLKGTGIVGGEKEVIELKLSFKKSAAALVGTAASGAPVASATITLKDSAGASRTGRTGADGKFAFDLTKLKPPFLLEVDLPGGGSLYGVALGPGVANVHPLTDLIIGSWYRIHGLDVATAFAGFSKATPVPEEIDIEILEGFLRKVVALWLTDRGLDPVSFHLIRSPFETDGTGFDAVLDATTLSPDRGTLTIDDGAVSQVTALTVSQAEGSITADTTVTAAAGTSASTSQTVIPTDATARTALRELQDALVKFRATVESRGAALTADDLLPFLDPDLLDAGMDRDLSAADMATMFRGITIDSMTIGKIYFYDAGAETVDVGLDFVFSAGGITLSDTVRFHYRKSGGKWRLYGDRRIAAVEAVFESQVTMTAGGTVGPRKHVNIDVRAPEGTVLSATVTLAGVFDKGDVPKDPLVNVETFEPSPGVEVEYRTDKFHTEAVLASDLPPGTPIVIDITPVAGPPVSYTFHTAASTSEGITVTAPTGHALADAKLGGVLDVAWTLPKTFPIVRVVMEGDLFTSSTSCFVEPGEAVIGPSTTSGTLRNSTTCGGLPVTSANLHLAVEGVNGERISLDYEFK